MKHLLAILCILFTIPAIGQYQYFSNINQNQVHDNVSFTGSNCGPRVQTSFKSFRQKSFISNSQNYGYISYDQPIKLKNGDYIGLGSRIMLYNSGLFDKRSGSILTSYNKQISNKNEIKQFLSLGLGFTLSQERISSEDLRWPDQIDSTGFNPDKPGEGDFIGDFLYPEIEIGISYSLFKTANEYLRVGISIKDVNQPNISFLGANPVPLPSTFILTAMGSTKAMDKLFWQPQVRLQKTQERSKISIVSNFKLMIGKKSNGIIMGAGYANNKVFSLNIGADLGRLTGLFSYDFNLNSEIATVVNPSLELGLGYRFCD